MLQDYFNAKNKLKTSQNEYTIYRLDALEKEVRDLKASGK